MKERSKFRYFFNLYIWRSFFLLLFINLLSFSASGFSKQAESRVLVIKITQERHSLHFRSTDGHHQGKEAKIWIEEIEEENEKEDHSNSVLNTNQIGFFTQVGVSSNLTSPPSYSHSKTDIPIPLFLLYHRWKYFPTV